MIDHDGKRHMSWSSGVDTHYCYVKYLDDCDANVRVFENHSFSRLVVSQDGVYLLAWRNGAVHAT